ncbi:MAG: DNA polymerase III subunit epsilon [Porticoccaceae bacterium]|jgi:DNA polymerase III subunit epsilon|nr:DNA polymerase III subunit epsilon [Porticoccaceae bacterium]
MTRQIVLDTETTGLDPGQGHRIIEIGCVELVDRKLTGRHFHQYINPERQIDEGAQQVHGITLESLQDKPVFSAVADDFLEFVEGAELVIHNAPFDLGFLNYELSLLGPNRGVVEEACEVLDSLVLARQMHPGQRNSLDALCKRYAIDNSQRDLHGALLDAELLAEVYLIMTGGQVGLGLSDDEGADQGIGKTSQTIRRLPTDRKPLNVIRANAEEMAAHKERLDEIKKESGQLVWQFED